MSEMPFSIFHSVYPYCGFGYTVVTSFMTGLK